MRRRLLRVVAALYIVLLPAAALGHAEPIGTASGLAMSAHDHGPHATCPPAKDTHCLACAVSLVSPPPSASRIAPPEVRRAECGHAETRDSACVAPLSTGRSPPSFPAI